MTAEAKAFKPAVGSKLDHALELARRGFYVFRLLPGAKTPAEAGWQSEATRDPDRIRMYWTDSIMEMEQPYNIGVLADRWFDGKQDRPALVVDLDVKPDKNGKIEFKKLADLPGNGKPPATLTAATPTDGRHLFFVCDRAVSQAIGRLGPGIDIKSRGNYVVGAGSTTEKGEYVFVNPSAAIAEAPAWLVGLCSASTFGRRAEATPIEKKAVQPQGATVVYIDQRQAEKRAISYLTSLPPAVEGERNHAGYKAACVLKDLGVPETDCAVLMELYWKCSPPLDSPEIEHCVKSAYKYGNSAPGSAAPEAQFDPIETPTAEAEGAAEIESIFWEPSKLPEIVDHVARAVLRDGDVFARGGRYVRLVQFPPRTKEQMRINRGGIEIGEFTQVSLRERIMRAVRFRDWQGKGAKSTQVDVICPGEVADTLYHRHGKDAPGLTGLVGAPTITHAGRLLTAPGYNAETGLFATFKAGDFSPINDNPSRQDAQAALRFLTRDVLADYPFDQEVDRYVAVAALLTGIVRSALDLAPAFLMEAASVQAGKTSLCQFVIGIPTTGTAVIPQSWADADERRKTVHTSLKEGQRVLLFDNIPKGTIIDDPTLAMILTSPTAQGRILGRSQSASYETDILVLLTGNNVQLKGDMDSRVLACRLSPPANRPEPTRSQLDQWMIEHRAEVVIAALTVVRAYAAAGYPVVEHFPGRFWQWGRFVQQPIIWAGGSDPAMKFITATEDDPEMEANARFFDAWYAVFTDRGVSAGDLRNVVQTADMAQESHKALAEVLWDMVTEGPMRRLADLSVQRIGVRLKELRDVRAGGYRLTGAKDEHLKSWRWYVVKE